MNQITMHSLNKMQILYRKLSRSLSKCTSDRSIGNVDVQAARSLHFDYQGQQANDVIRDILIRDQPCMIARFGGNELSVILTYLNINDNVSSIAKSIKYIKGEIGPFWFSDSVKHRISYQAGFFPSNETYLNMFVERMLSDSRNIDILGSWLEGEARLVKIFPHAKIVRLEDLEPYYHEDPWSQMLENKTVLVIHPFSDSIEQQYRKHRNGNLLFRDPRMLPEFELKTLKAVQSSRGSKKNFCNWFDALDWMCEQVSRIDFDIAIIGAGAYGFPLASFVKSIGKKAVHLGGATQILFGIRGLRWDRRARCCCPREPRRHHVSR